MNDSPAIAPARSRFLRFSPAAAKRKGGGVHLIAAGILLVLTGFCACPPQDIWPMYLLPVPFLLLAWWRGVRWQRWLAIFAAGGVRDSCFHECDCGIPDSIP